jgi:hypothetical protein
MHPFGLFLNWFSTLPPELQQEFVSQLYSKEGWVAIKGYYAGPAPKDPGSPNPPQFPKRFCPACGKPL